MKFDYQPPLTHLGTYKIRRYFFPSLLAFVSLFIIVFALTKFYFNTEISEEISNEEILDLNTNSKNATEQELIPEPKEIQNWRKFKIKAGDSLSTLFNSVGIGLNELNKIIKANPLGKNLANLHPGQTLAFLLDSENRVKEISLNLTAAKTLHIKPTDESYKYYYHEKVASKKLKYIEGKVKDSFYNAAIAAKLPNKAVMQLINIFAWDIDFGLDIRRNDSFKIIYEEKFLDDEKVGTGNIIMAELINKNKNHKAIRYTAPNGHTGYYNPQGFAMQKAFLRNPVKFLYIGSKFSYARKHPILHKIRAHRGVDFVAPHGTPIKAAGDGKVSFVGTKNGYGKTVEIQHGTKYSTLYAHLSKFAQNTTKGTSVKQGQVIGYVGKTGLATGDHLHYEFRVNGIHRDPLTVELPKSLPIRPEYKEHFNMHTRNSIALLDTYSKPDYDSQLAQNTQ